jgi:hypothetical protein
MARLLVVLALSLCIPMPAAADSIWTHNGSEMRLVVDRLARTFIYERPRSGIAAEGVQSGTVLFKGTLTDASNGKYAGIAYIFSARCGSKSFRVTGDLVNDADEIHLQGDAPVVDRSSCQPTGKKHSLLVFKFVRSETPPPPSPAIARGDICGFTDDPDGTKSAGYQACLETEANRVCPNRPDIEDHVRCFRAAIALVHKRSGMTGNASVIADTPFTQCNKQSCTMSGGGSLYSCERIDATRVRECEDESCNEVVCPLRQCRIMCAKSQ